MSKRDRRNRIRQIREKKELKEAELKRRRDFAMPYIDNLTAAIDEAIRVALSSPGVILARDELKAAVRANRVDIFGQASFSIDCINPPRQYVVDEQVIDGFFSTQDNRLLKGLKIATDE